MSTEFAWNHPSIEIFPCGSLQLRFSRVSGWVISPKCAQRTSMYQWLFTRKVDVNSHIFLALENIGQILCDANMTSLWCRHVRFDDDGSSRSLGKMQSSRWSVSDRNQGLQDGKGQWSLSDPIDSTVISQGWQMFRIASGWAYQAWKSIEKCGESNGACPAW